MDTGTKYFFAQRKAGVVDRVGLIEEIAISDPIYDVNNCSFMYLYKSERSNSLIRLYTRHGRNWQSCDRSTSLPIQFKSHDWSPFTANQT